MHTTCIARRNENHKNIRKTVSGNRRYGRSYESHNFKKILEYLFRRLEYYTMVGSSRIYVSLSFSSLSCELLGPGQKKLKSALLSGHHAQRTHFIPRCMLFEEREKEGVRRKRREKKMFLLLLISKRTGMCRWFHLVYTFFPVLIFIITTVHFIINISLFK